MPLCIICIHVTVHVYVCMNDYQKKNLNCSHMSTELQNLKFLINEQTFIKSIERWLCHELSIYLLEAGSSFSSCDSCGNKSVMVDTFGTDVALYGLVHVTVLDLHYHESSKVGHALIGITFSYLSNVASYTWYYY